MTELDVYQPPGNLFGVDNPAAVVARSTETANALTEVIQNKRLYANIGARSHVTVDGWTLLGSMLGVFPIVVWTRRLVEPHEGWEARVEARTLEGKIVGAAEAQCSRDENTWKSRDDYALRSMAQTRATSKALRGPLGFIVHLAGFAATPAEEMPADKAEGAVPSGETGSPPEQAPAAPSAFTDPRTPQERHQALVDDLDGNPDFPPPDGATSWKDYSNQLRRQKFAGRPADWAELDHLLNDALLKGDTDIPF